MQWIDAGAVSEWRDGETKSVPAGARMVAVVRTEGKFFAVEDVCTHDGSELVGGGVEGLQIICPRHGARFCLRTGAALTPPAYEAVKVFETRIDADHVWVRCD